jgi:hypothetical protein
VQRTIAAIKTAGTSNRSGGLITSQNPLLLRFCRSDILNRLQNCNAALVENSFPLG